MSKTTATTNLALLAVPAKLISRKLKTTAGRPPVCLSRRRRLRLPCIIARTVESLSSCSFVQDERGDVVRAYSLEKPCAAAHAMKELNNRTTDDVLQQYSKVRGDYLSPPLEAEYYSTQFS